MTPRDHLSCPDNSGGIYVSSFSVTCFISRWTIFFSSEDRDAGRNIFKNPYNSAIASPSFMHIWQRHKKWNAINGSRPTHYYEPTLGQITPSPVFLASITELALRVEIALLIFIIVDVCVWSLIASGIFGVHKPCILFRTWWIEWAHGFLLGVCCFAWSCHAALAICNWCCFWFL